MEEEGTACVGFPGRFEFWGYRLFEGKILGRAVCFSHLVELDGIFMTAERNDIHESSSRALRSTIAQTMAIEKYPV